METPHTPAPNKQKPLHAGHRSRMRRRFLTNGLDGFSDHEVLELLLFYAVPRQDVNPMAHLLLDQFGSLPGVLSASEEELCTVRGVGPKIARFLTLIPDVLLQTEHCLLAPSRTPLRTPDDLAALMTRRSSPSAPGDTFVIPLDGHYNVLAVYPYATFEELDVRELALLCLKLNSQAVALAECLEDPVPLLSDRRIEALTGMQSTLNTLDILLVDYYRFSPGCTVLRSSARDGSLLPR